MTTKHVKFDGSIPEIYDSHLGPLLFHHYAADLAGRIHVAAGGRVLETACGTGIATEKLRDVLADDIEIIATDLNDANFAVIQDALDKHGVIYLRNQTLTPGQQVAFTERFGEPDVNFNALDVRFLNES